jgi:hypothetical protein
VLPVWRRTDNAQPLAIFQNRWLLKGGTRQKENWQQPHSSSVSQKPPEGPDMYNAFREDGTYGHGSRINKCQGCGARGDRMHVRDQCPAAGKLCFNCDTKGHFLRVCRKPPRQHHDKEPQPPRQRQDKKPQWSRSVADRTTQTADTARQILTTYVASIERKKLRLINFMAVYGEDTAVFDKYSLTILNTYIKSLRDQVSHMETNWDTMRGDGSLSLVALMEIGPLFEQAQTLAEEILDQADMFCIDQAKIVDPPRNQTNWSVERTRQTRPRKHTTRLARRIVTRVRGKESNKRTQRHVEPTGKFGHR